MNAIRRCAWLGIVAALSFALPGCDSMTGALDDEPAFGTDAGGSGGTGTLRVSNNYFTAATIYYSRCSQDSWGSSRGTLAAYATRSYSVNAGCWDVLADRGGPNSQVRVEVRADSVTNAVL